MEVKFSQFRFDMERQVLYNNDGIVPLKRNQTALLNFFLSEPEHIHSKESILDTVWQNKVVSEQVVFQTISQLRNILGEDAIKTFSKQGYKWQLPLIVKEQDVLQAVTSDSKRNSRSAMPVGLIVAALALGLLIFIILGLTAAQENNPKLAFHPLGEQGSKLQPQSEFNRILVNALADEDFELATTVNSALTTRQAFATPKLAWTKAELDKNDWLIWGETFKGKQGTYARYGLAKENLKWTGYVYGKDMKEVTHNFKNKLAQLKKVGLFSLANKTLDITTLSTMRQKSLHDPDILLMLAEHHIDIDHLDVALTYLHKLLNQDQTYAVRPYQALAQWQIGRIYKMREQHEQANNSLFAMSEILADTPLWPLIYHNIKTQAWLAYAQNDTQLMFNTLDKGLEVGKQQADPLSLFDLHILYATLAEKVSANDKKYQHLNLAQALYLQHDLEQSNQAVIYYHFALFTKDNKVAVPYLEKVLALPRSAQNYWVQDQATEILVEHYLDNKNYDAAHLVVKTQPIRPKQMVLKARIWHHQQQLDSARQLLDQAFEQARLEYDVTTGLQAALLLYQLTPTQPQLRAEYLAYMQSNADQAWLTRHQAELSQK